MKKLLFSIGLLLLCLIGIGQTATWNFGTSTGSAAPSATPVAGVTISNLAQGNNNGTTTLIDNSSVSSGYTGASGNYNAGAAARTGSLATGSGGSAYFEITLTPVTSSDKVVLTGINFGSRSTSTGPQAYTVRSSLDNYGSDLASGTLSNTSTWAYFINTASVTGAPNTTVKIRIYGYNGSGNPNANTANWRIDDLSINLGPAVSVAAGTNPAEPATNGNFIISLTPAAPAGGITVNYTLSGTAALGADYTDPNNGSVFFPVNTTTLSVPINVIDDNLQESAETIILTINSVSPSGSYTISTSNGSATLTLADDNDGPVINYTGATYNQDFNTLTSTGTSATLPTGFYFSESGSSANTTYTAGTGSSATGDTYSFGASGSTERALGGVRSGNLVPAIGALIINNTGSVLSSVVIAYTGEQWRLGAAGRADRLDFQYSTNANSLTTGTWTDVDALDFTGPIMSGTAGALNGNAAANRRLISYNLSGLAIPVGAKFFIRWSDFDATSSDDGLAVDEFSLSNGCTPPANQPATLAFTPSVQSIQGTFNNAIAGTAAADHYLVVMSTSATLSAQPASGTAYALDDIIGGGNVVAITDGTNNNSFTATGLTPGTAYYFFVYAYAAGTSCYNLTNPLTGIATTNAPPACTPPALQTSSISATTITPTSITLNYTRGNGDNMLVVVHNGSAVDEDPINSVNYSVGSSIGNGNTVVYNGPAATFAYNSLAQNTQYYFSFYEYNNVNVCYLKPSATANFRTICSTPIDVTALSAGTGNTQSAIAWVVPVNTCYDEVLVVVSGSSINGSGSSYTGTANAVYTAAGTEQVVYRGSGNTVTISGLTNNTTYYIKVFTRLGAAYSSGTQVTVTPFDPATGFTYLFGNMHAHSSYSDGNKDNTANTPDEDFAFARDALCMDYMGMSEHNHAGAGMNIANYHTGYNEANSLNLTSSPSGNSIVTLWGMEWGTISGGGHVLVYGFDDQLLGWEPGNFDINVPKSDYTALFNAVTAKSGAVAMLAHPNSTDFSNIAGTAYSTTADEAIVGVAVESGPAFSTSTSYNDVPSRLQYLNYYKNMLAKGYHLAPGMDMDNHNLTFGRANANRTVLLATAKTREAVMEAFRNSRYYASEDCNLRLDFRLGSSPMGSNVTGAALPTLSLNSTDINDEGVVSIELWGGPAGGAVPATFIKSYTGTAGFNFTPADGENLQPDGTTWYYYVILTQDDADKAVTAPIWYTRNSTILPVTFLQFNASFDATGKKVNLLWSTAQEMNSKEFVLERSVDGIHFNAIGTITAAGSSQAIHQYQYIDGQPQQGVSYYRVQQVDMDGKAQYSAIRKVSTDNKTAYYTIYPNPAKGFTYVTSTTTESQAVSIRILDNLGRLLNSSNKTISGYHNYKIDLSGCQPGIYFIQVKGKEKTTTEKIVVYWDNGQNSW